MLVVIAVADPSLVSIFLPLVFVARIPGKALMPELDHVVVATYLLSLGRRGSVCQDG